MKIFRYLDSDQKKQLRAIREASLISRYNDELDTIREILRRIMDQAKDTTMYDWSNTDGVNYALWTLKSITSDEYQIYLVVNKRLIFSRDITLTHVTNLSNPKSYLDLDELISLRIEMAEQAQYVLKIKTNPDWFRGLKYERTQRLKLFFSRVFET